MESPIPRPPKKAPIDWFEPNYWNFTMSLRERVNIVRDGVRVLLPKEELCQNWPDILRWKKLSKQDFMRLHGNAVLQDYDIPTAEEIEQMDASEDSSDTADEDDAHAVETQLQNATAGPGDASGSGSRA